MEDARLRRASTGTRSQRLGRLPLGRKGKWDLEERTAGGAKTTDLELTRETATTRWSTSVSLFRQPRARSFRRHQARYSARRIPRRASSRRRVRRWWRTVFDLLIANYGVDRGFGGDAMSQERVRTTLYAGLGRRSTGVSARQDHPGRARIRVERRKDQRTVDGHHRRGDEPLVPWTT